jgi:hypothetical protein
LLSIASSLSVSTDSWSSGERVFNADLVNFFDDEDALTVDIINDGVGVGECACVTGIGERECGSKTSSKAKRPLAVEGPKETRRLPAALFAVCVPAGGACMCVT